MDELKHILIIDDSVTSLKHAEEMLKDTYKLALSKSGQQALQFLKTNKPDLILLDINMPQMDGYEILQELKGNADTRNIPVIFLTGDNNNESELKGFRLGAMDFITKPFVPEIVKSRIDRIIELDALRKNLEGQVKIQSSQLETYKEVAQKDGLTGMYNRNSLKQLVDTHVSTEHSGIFMMVDMDNFKTINDTFGHLVGDEVLIKFADAIRDSISDDNLCGRIGGDEFVIFLRTVKDRDMAKEMATRIRDSIKREFFNSYVSKVSISMGIAMAGIDGDDFETLYNNADKSLYYVKQNGKDSFHFFSEDTVDNDNTAGKSVQVDIEHLTSIIKEETPVNGAYLVEYEGFKKIYRFLERVISRTKTNVQMVLFTISHNDESVDPDILENAMDELGEVVSKSLRKGDVGTRYSSCQYIIILMGTQKKDALMVAGRIAEAFDEQIDNEAIRIDFDINNIELE